MIGKKNKQKEIESSLREILSSTKQFLSKHKEGFHFNISDNSLYSRFEVQVLMGRFEYEEVYVFTYQNLLQYNYCKAFYDNFGKQITINLKLNKLIFK